MFSLNTYGKNTAESENEKICEVESDEQENKFVDKSQVKNNLRKLAIASPILATLGFIVAILPLLSIAPAFASEFLFTLSYASPPLALVLEVLALVFGIIAVKKLPMKTSARGIAAAGIYIASTMFAAIIVIIAYFIISTMMAGISPLEVFGF